MPFFHTQEGRLRGLRVGACCYVFNTLVSMIGDGWRSLSWIAWLLMALGFFAVSAAVEVSRPARSKGNSLSYVFGVAAIALSVGLLFYRLVGHLRAT